MNFRNWWWVKKDPPVLKGLKKSITAIKTYVFKLSVFYIYRKNMRFMVEKVCEKV